MADQQTWLDTEDSGLNIDSQARTEFSDSQDTDMGFVLGARFEGPIGLIQEGTKDQFGHDGDVEHAHALGIDLGQAEMRFPSLEEHFNTPTDFIDGLKLGGLPDVRADVGDEYIPSEQE